MPSPKPWQPPNPVVRALLFLLAILMTLTLITWRWPRLIDEPTSFGRLLYGLAVVEWWAWCHPKSAAALFVALAVAGVALYKHWLLARSARFTRRVTGLHDDLKGLDFPPHDYQLAPYLLEPRRGLTFVGLTPKSRLSRPGFGKRFAPVYLSEEERSMHRHVLGKTGSGKTTSILWPQVLQDALAGKGLLVMDAKGSDENATTMRAIARAAGREADFRMFSLPAWNQPQLFSHAYNMVYVRPPAHPDDAGGDVQAMLERVFSVFQLGDNVYFKTQSLLAFTRVGRVLHGMLDSKGRGEPFTMRDIGVCVRGIGAPPRSPSAVAFRHCLQTTRDTDAAEELCAQVVSLGKQVGPCLSGLLGAVDRFQSPLVNATQPDIIFEEALQKNLLIYAQLPSNLYKLQAPALAKVMLMDLQQEASLRQVFRGQRNQKAFSACIDEFGSFADLSFIDSLNKLRDAHIQFTLAHQSMADLELIGKEFAQAVLDNTRTRDVLALDNPELCDRLAGSMGTRPRLEHTVQQGPDVLSTITATGALSTRAVEAYRLHPNRLKQLAARGQGFLFATRRGGMVAIPIHYAPMPTLRRNWTEELPRLDQGKAAGLRLYERFIKGKPRPTLALVASEQRRDPGEDATPSAG